MINLSNISERAKVVLEEDLINAWDFGVLEALEECFHEKNDTLRGALVCSRTDFSHAACLLNLSRTVIMYRWLLLAIHI